MTLKKVQLEILDLTGHVIRTHHFWFDADYGSQFILTMDKNEYIVDKNGKIENKS